VNRGNSGGLLASSFLATRYEHCFSNRKISGTYEKLELDATHTKQTAGAISNRKILRFFRNANPIFGHPYSSQRATPARDCLEDCAAVPGSAPPGVGAAREFPFQWRVVSFCGARVCWAPARRFAIWRWEVLAWTCCPLFSLPLGRLRVIGEQR
jgi:hypothetical protein